MHQISKEKFKEKKRSERKKKKNKIRSSFLSVRKSLKVKISFEWKIEMFSFHKYF